MLLVAAVCLLPGAFAASYYNSKPIKPLGAPENGSPLSVIDGRMDFGSSGAGFDISTLNFSTDGYATGSCSINTTPGARVLCGSDRDDDGFITNADSHPQSGVVGDFDDDFADGVGTATIGCFERDLGNSDPVNAADNDWDDVTVIVQDGATVSTFPPGVSSPLLGGTAWLSLTTQAASCGTPSGH